MLHWDETWEVKTDKLIQKGSHSASSCCLCCDYLMDFEWHSRKVSYVSLLVLILCAIERFNFSFTYLCLLFFLLLSFFHLVIWEPGHLCLSNENRQIMLFCNLLSSAFTMFQCIRFLLIHTVVTCLAPSHSCKIRIKTPIQAIPKVN